MNRAFLFPGQGSQHVGMGQDLYDKIPASRAVFDEADRILGFPITEYCFGVGRDSNAALEALTHTAVCQPALYTHSMAVMAALELSPDYVAGHSLGEYSALCACGAISFEDGLRLVRLRGELMAIAGQSRAGGMAAVVGLDFETIEAACSELSANGELVVPANYNSPAQVVISGDLELVRSLESNLKSLGARMFVPLVVSGAFHSPLVQGARAKLADALQELDIRRPSCPIYLNVTARPTQAPEVIRARMLEQLTSPVRWSQTIESMSVQTHFIEIGPGRVLSGLVRRTLGRSAQITAISRVADVERAERNCRAA